MTLTFEQIKQITRGYERAFETENGVKFCRFTEAEQEAYAKHHTELHIKTNSTTGITAEFKTDADVIKLGVFTEKAMQLSLFAMDIYVDGKFAHWLKNFPDDTPDYNFITQPCEFGEFCESFELGKQGEEKTIKIVFPWTVAAKLCELTLENASYVVPVRKNDIMLMYGDSITHGHHAKHPSLSYANRLAAAFDCECLNKAIGAEVYFPELAKAAIGEKEGFCPKYVTIAYGTNDWRLTTKESFCKRCPEFIRTIKEKYPSAKIFVLSPIWRTIAETENTDFGSFYEVEPIIEQACNEVGVNFISGIDLVPHDEKMFADLCLHPGDDGFAHYAANLEKKMRALL